MKIKSLLTGINLVILIILVNIIVFLLPRVRIDLSENKVHSLSQASKKIVANLDDLVTIKVYMTSDLPSEIKPIAENLKTIVGEIANLNKGKIKVNFLDPSRSEEIKNEAEKMGIQPLQFSSIKSDKFEVQNGYFGLALIYGDKKEVLPVAGDVGNLEYFLVSGIKKLTTKTVATVAMAVNNQGQDQYQYLRKFLEQNYRVAGVTLDGDSKLPEGAESLLIIGRNNKIDEKGLEKIKDWVTKGKGLIVFLDKVAVDQNMQARKIEDTGLESILKDYGIEIENKLVIDANSSIANFRTGNGAFLTQYPYWPLIRPENMNKEIPAVSGISSLTLAWVSPLNLSGEAKYLMQSSSQSFMDDSYADISPVSKRELKKDEAKQYVVAAMNTEKIKLAVAGDADFISDQFVVNDRGNLNFALNLVDYFSQDSSLLEIRSKSLVNNPLMPVSNRVKMIIRGVGVGCPIIFLLLGAAIGLVRRKKKNQKW